MRARDLGGPGCISLFERIIPLPDGLDLDSAEATFDKGVLTIRIPKSRASTETAEREIKIH